MHSNCSSGFIGPLCQTCDFRGAIKYTKVGLDDCVVCKQIDESIPEIIGLTLLIFVFYVFFLWFFFLNKHVTNTF